MATPAMVTITGTVQKFPGTGDGTAKVILEQQVWLTHSDGTVIQPQKYVGVADSNGQLSVMVPPTTDPAWLPQNWTFRVTFDGVEEPQWAKPFRVVIPHTDQSITLGDLIPVGAASDGVIYAPANHTHSGFVTTAGLPAAVQALLDDGFAVTDRFSVSATGGMDWGPSGGPNDVNLYRGDSDLLFTDNRFQARVLRAQTALQIGGTDLFTLTDLYYAQNDRVATQGEFVIRRRDANSRFKLVSGNLYLTHFRATQTITVTSIRTTAKVGATGTDNAYIGILNWAPGVNYTPNAVSVDDPSRWANPVSYDTLLFKATPGTGVANLADPGFNMVAGQNYAAFVLWNGDGGAQGPELVACLVNDEDAMIEPRENAYIVLAAPPSSALMPEWVAASPAQIQGFLKQ